MVKIKKRGDRYIIYRRGAQLCVCSNKETALLWRDVLKEARRV